MPAEILEPPPSVAPPSAPAPKTAINVSALPAPVESPKPAKPGSARDRFQGEMSKKFGGEPAKDPPPPPKADEKPAEKVEAKVAEGDEPAPEVKTADAKPETPQPELAGKKPSPWKLLEQYKTKYTEAEKQILELKNSVVPEAERTAITTRLQAAEKRAQELEDEIRHVNYAKSQEFQDKHQKPYEQAWQRAMSELHELTITDPSTQQARSITANDIMELVNLPLQKAREVANAVFGDFADDVMSHRTEIKRLFSEQSAALDEAKKTGAEREAKRKQDFQTMYGTVSKQTKDMWDKVNSEVQADPKYGEFFKPREGDEEWNTRLDAGFKLVAQAFSENPMDPRLSPEQRAEVIKRHSAIRNMAAGWRPLHREVTKLRGTIKELEGELKKYKETTPGSGGTVVASSTVKTSGNAKAGMWDALQKIAK